MREPTFWEYRVLTIGSAWRGAKDEEIEETLNEWGAEGWEVTSAFGAPGGNKVTLVAKRPLSRAPRRHRTVPGEIV